MFGVTEAGSTVETEIKAGASTFLTMAYILLVNPSMLSVTGIPFEDALFATAIVDLSVCSILFDMLIARKKERGPRIKRPGALFVFRLRVRQ